MKGITDHIRGYPIEDTSKQPFFDIDSYYSSDHSKQLDSDNVMDYEVNINSDYSSSNDDSKLNPSVQPVKIFENRSGSAIVILPKISTTQNGVYSSDISAKIEENGEVPNDQADGSSGSVVIMSKVCDSEVKPKGKTVSVVLLDKDDNVEAQFEKLSKNAVLPSCASDKVVTQKHSVNDGEGQDISTVDKEVDQKIIEREKPSTILQQDNSTQNEERNHSADKCLSMNGSIPLTCASKGSEMDEAKQVLNSKSEETVKCENGEGSFDILQNHSYASPILPLVTNAAATSTPNDTFNTCQPLDLSKKTGMSSILTLGPNILKNPLFYGPVKMECKEGEGDDGFTSNEEIIGEVKFILQDPPADIDESGDLSNFKSPSSHG